MTKVLDGCSIQANDSRVANYSLMYINFTYTGSPYQLNLSDSITLVTGTNSITNTAKTRIKMVETGLTVDPVGSVQCREMEAVYALAKAAPSFVAFSVLIISIALGLR